MRPVTELRRTVAPFEVVSEYTPSGDQPAAIAELTQRVNPGRPSAPAAPAAGEDRRRTHRAPR
ncbi:MAG: hypothetical protein FWE61_04170 [Micrococcales bacterium]|nr:hypothetical protein [Micrococcales bacterium]